MFGNTNRYSFDKIPDLTGKLAIITGSNSGIGRVCALEMARKGCAIILACRNKDRAEPTVEKIKKETGNPNIHFMELDLLSLDSVTRFAKEFKKKHSQLHILMNNAGIMVPPYSQSKDGLESQFATNHVAHHYLTMLLLPVLEATSPSRIVTVSSVGHKLVMGGLNLETINDPAKYNRLNNYGKSKACNILFTRELSRRLKEKGIKVYANCNHPGLVKSELGRYIPNRFVKAVGEWAGIPTEDGALTQLYLATSPEIEEREITGKYYIPYGQPSSPGGPAASDKGPEELWTFTEKLLREKVPEYKGAPI
ncbi:hypothetical protein BDB01DRAFT_772580 [Pilobolus umbonatus]|nr:hypothetical protein BDB01DRAFT_772580 [Pilobolus umbonatus]